MFYANFEYDGGENRFRKNFMIYKGKQETSVIANTFHRNSKDQMKSQSENLYEWKEIGY